MDKSTILKAAVTLAETRGYDNVYKRHIANVLGCGMGTVNFHWQTMAALREAIIDHASEQDDTELLTGTLRRA